MYEFKERKHLRYKVDGSAIAMLMGDPMVLDDISRGGLGFHLYRADKLPPEFDIDLIVSSEEKPLGNIRCRLVADRLMAGEPTGSFVERRIGLEFIEPAPELQEKVDKYIKEQESGV